MGSMCDEAGAVFAPLAQKNSVDSMCDKAGGVLDPLAHQIRVGSVCVCMCVSL